MLIQWNVEKEPDPELLSLMQTAADVAEKAECVECACSISVRICSDEEIHEVNRTYRNVDRATDVLSFPTVNYPEGKTASQCIKRLMREYDDETGTCFLGDIIISLPHALAQAKEYGHSSQRECAYLLVHGICHLMGYDHMEEEEKKKMRELEEKIMSESGLSKEETKYATDEELLELARKAMEKSYSPYSHFPVGAALLCEDGKIFTGCNIENASYSVTMCGERTALFKAVSEGERNFRTVAIAANTEAWPCGTCRQAFYEFAPDIRVIITWKGENGVNEVREKILNELLPGGFGPSSLL